MLKLVAKSWLELTGSITGIGLRTSGALLDAVKPLPLTLALAPRSEAANVTGRFFRLRSDRHHPRRPGAV
jgi:hypothetical protein